MPTVGIEIKGYNRVNNKIRKIASNLDKELDAAIGQWTKDTRKELKAQPYPPKFVGPYPWVSEKQRRYVMAAIRRGEIQVPYRRTGTIANSWSAVRVRPSQWRLYNSAQYADYVVGNRFGKRQARIHRGRWYLANDVISKRLPLLRRVVEAKINRLIKTA